MGREKGLGLRYAPALWAALSLSTAADTELPEVVVESSAGSIEERREAVVGRIVFPEEEVRRFGDASVGEVLRRLPGVTFTGPPGTIKDIRMRGLDKGYTQILIDGEPVPGSTGDRQIQVDRLPAHMIERIEIIRNPTADIDSAGIGGTVNIILKKTPERSLARAGVGAGTTGGEPIGQASAQLGNRHGGLGYLLSGGVTDRAEINRDTKVGFNADGTVKDSLTEDKHVDIIEYTFAPRLRWDLEDGWAFKLDPFVIATDESRTKDQRKFNALGAPNGSQLEREDKQRVIARLHGSWERTVDSGRRARLALTAQQGREDKEREASDRNASGVITKQTREDAEQRENELTARAAFDWPTGDVHQLRFGADVARKSREDAKTTIENGVPRTAGLNDAFDIEEYRYAVHVQDAIAPGGSAVLTPGLRLEALRTSSTDGGGNEFDNTVFAANPSLHYLQRLREDLNFRASIARTLRLPRFADLSLIVESRSGTLTDPDRSGNPRLEPERATGVEIGIEKFFDSTSGVAAIGVFHRDIQDLIERQTRLEGARFVSRPENVGDAKVWGIEFDVRRSAAFLGAPNLVLMANYTLLRSRVETAAGRLQDMKDQPPYVFNVGADYRIPGWETSFGIAYNYLAAFTSDATADDGSRELKSESAKRLLDAYLAQPLGRNLTLKLAAYNLFKDDKFRDTTKFNSAGAFASRETRLEESERTFLLSLEGVW